MAPSQWICSSCGTGFETKGKRDSHHRKEHQNVSHIKPGDCLEHELRRSRHGKFICECRREYETGQALRKHKTRCIHGILGERPESVQEQLSKGIIPILLCMDKGKGLRWALLLRTNLIRWGMRFLNTC